MLTYRYNLSGIFSPEDYDKIAKKALAAAKGASAIDTGAYRRSWRVQVTGDFLLVSSSLRYAAPVELGSSVHKVHKHKIRNALAKIGLDTGTVSLGAGKSNTFSTGASASASSRPAAATLGRGTTSTASSITPLTLAEIRSPALILNRMRAQAAQRPKLPTGLPTISKSQLFNRTFLTAAIVAAVALQEEEPETQNE